MVKALSAASSSVATEYPLSKETLAKNSKLALLKQLSFLHAKFSFPFGFADALTQSSGNALINSETKVSVILPRHIHRHMFKKSSGNKSLSFCITSCVPA